MDTIVEESNAEMSLIQKEISRLQDQERVLQEILEYEENVLLSSSTSNE